MIINAEVDGELQTLTDDSYTFLAHPLGLIVLSKDNPDSDTASLYTWSSITHINDSAGLASLLTLLNA